MISKADMERAYASVEADSTKNDGIYPGNAVRPLASLYIYAGFDPESVSATPPLTPEEKRILKDMNSEAEEYRTKNGKNLIWMIPE